MFNYDRMNALIKKSGKSKLFLCGQLGKGKTYLRDAEKQKTNISGETLSILAAELNTTPEYLTGETDSPNAKKETSRQSESLSQKDIALIKWFRSLPTEKQKAILIAQDAPENLVE